MDYYLTVRSLLPQKQSLEMEKTNEGGGGVDGGGVAGAVQVVIGTQEVG